jgi:integrase
MGEHKWFVRWSEGVGADGKRRYRSQRVRGTKADAQRFLNGVLRSRDLGEYVRPTKLSVDAFLDRWLADGARGSSRSIEGARWLLAKHVRPRIGRLRLDRLSPLDIQGILSAIRQPRPGRHPGPAGDYTRTCRAVVATLRRALKQAVRWRLIARNPADDVDLPRKTSREMPALSMAEVGKLREALRGTKHALVFDVLLATGARPGEILALRWRDLDLRAGTLAIQRALTWEMKLRQDGEPARVRVFAEPKTSRSRRTIPLPESLVKTLSLHKAVQAEHALKLGGIYNRDADLVFADEIGAPLDAQNLNRRHFRPAVKRAGLSSALRVYDLRHTHATLLLAAGESVPVVSERLGHASAAMTLDVYAHVLAGQQEAATRKIEAAIFGG